MNNAAITVTMRKFRDEYTQERFTGTCHNYVENTWGFPVEDSNDRSWDDCYSFLSKYLSTEEQYQDFHLVFEFAMPDSQRRANVLLLTQNKVMILEFKKKEKIQNDAIAQVAGYGQSISHYHYLTEKNDMAVSTHLVYTPGNPTGRRDLVDILHPENFTQAVKEYLSGETPMSEDACNGWVASPFHPLKNIAEATLQLFRDGDLPNIKNIREGDIKDTLAYINRVIDDATCQKKILFVSGVPGAGKTLVGLKTVYDHGRSDAKLSPIYLSGNGPLINILQNTLSVNQLEGRSYVQEMKIFKRWARASDPPMNNIIVFDEAQRAWDTDTMEKGQTEATLLLRIGDNIAKQHGKVTIICLIGDGQAIHKNEETGMPLWVDALANRDDWNVYVPENYDPLFSRKSNCEKASELMLNTSIRHDFIDVSPWVEAILSLDLNRAKSIYQDMLKKGFECECFRDKKKLPELVQRIQNNYPGGHTGIVVSSHLKACEKLRSYLGPQYNGSFVKAEETYSWYMNEGPKLKRGASEFLIQGIELECPIVAFVGDYYIQNGQWILDKKAHFDDKIRNPATLIQNVYRVLLTRSRKGMFLYFPQDPKLDETYQWFESMLQIGE